ncbi:MAG TPA: hypothetical protein VLY45_04710 [Nitrospiria bacterium]|nr:hypothetical protein [Nitrospiria bacterium]
MPPPWIVFGSRHTIVRAATAKPAGVGGFLEDGLAAMVGAMFVSMWFGLSHRKGGPATLRSI